eukprot:1159144-Pelagomonas_calceolata.AAC.7
MSSRNRPCPGRRSLLLCTRRSHSGMEACTPVRALRVPGCPVRPWRTHLHGARMECALGKHACTSISSFG